MYIIAVGIAVVTAAMYRQCDVLARDCTPCQPAADGPWTRGNGHGVRAPKLQLLERASYDKLPV